MQQQQQKRDDLSQMVAEARQYAEAVTPQGLEWFDTYNKRFAELVREKEREACAKLVSDIEWKCVVDDVDDTPLKEIVKAIRARGNNE